MGDQDAQVGKRTMKKRKESAILIEGVIKRLARNTTLGKFPGISKENPS